MGQRVKAMGASPYSEEFKKQAVLKFINRGSKTVKELSSELNTNGNFVADGTIYSADVFGDPVNYRVTITPNGVDIKEVLVGIFPSMLSKDPNDRVSKFEEEAVWFYSELINYNGLL